ncbi:MAG: TetR/AcrR family transcriptional regulator [Saprospiraceae bacterium]
MDREKRKVKEDIIIKAAEVIFETVGFSNAKMENIAAKAGITKVTLYSYFQSKENLFMAITYKAFQYLIDVFYHTIDENKSKPGIDGTIGIHQAFIDFCENNFLYSETILNYFSLIRSSAGGREKDKISSGIADSIYFKKIKNIQNLPLKLTSQEIIRGKKDGSISSKIDAILLTLQGWSMNVGYIKLITSSGESTTLLNADLREIKKLNSVLIRAVLSN